MSLGPLLTLAVESIAPTAEAKGVSIATSLGTTPRIRVGRPRSPAAGVLEPALERGEIHAERRARRGAHATQRVRDVRGRLSPTPADGIAPAFLPHVFERFRQADGSSTRDARRPRAWGSPSCRHLVELHGGRMTADSAGEGHGIDILRVPARP